MRDLLNSVTVKRVISSISGAGDNVAQVGQIIDHQGYESATYVIDIGSVVDADATFAVTLDEGDTATLTDAAAVANADMISQGTGAPLTNAGFQFDDDNEVRTLGYRGTKRYTRLTLTPSLNTGAWPIGAVCVLGHRRDLPFAQPAS